MAITPGMGPPGPQISIIMEILGSAIIFEKKFIFQTTSHIFLRQPRGSLTCETPISGPRSKFGYFLAPGAQIEPSIGILELGLPLVC